MSGGRSAGTSRSKEDSALSDTTGTYFLRSAFSYVRILASYMVISGVSLSLKVKVADSQ